MKDALDSSEVERRPHQDARSVDERGREHEALDPVQKTFVVFLQDERQELRSPETRPTRTPSRAPAEKYPRDARRREDHSRNPHAVRKRVRSITSGRSAGDLAATP